MRTFEEEIKFCVEMFEEMRPEHDVIPMARLTTPKGEVIALIDGADTVRKRKHALSLMITEHKATELVFMSDVWMKMFKTDEVPEHVGSLADYPDSTEAFLVGRVDANGYEVRVMHYTMEAGKVAWGERMDSMASGTQNESELFETARVALMSVVDGSDAPEDETVSEGIMKFTAVDCREVKVGDVVTRMLAGTIPMELPVVKVNDELIYATTPELAASGLDELDPGSMWTFDRSTGFEVDEELNFGPSFGITGSFITEWRKGGT